uniref:Tetraspanin n=1 Tax=Echeneis naucrates TaxID=173247 RepID=A0A665X7P4_ECHNA
MQFTSQFKRRPGLHQNENRHEDLSCFPASYCGAAILGVGIWVKVDAGSLLDVLHTIDNAASGISQLVNVSYLLIALGVVLVVIGFLGCCGAIRESRCMLLTFFSIVLIIFLAEVAGAVVLLVFKDLVSDVKKSLDYGKDEGVTSLWNATMEEFHCCGYKNYTDFDFSPFYNEHGGNFYPLTCCNATITKATYQITFSGIIYLIEDNAVIIAAVALGIAAFEIAAMVVSMVLYKNIGK